MAYITSSITSANPSADLYTAMAPALTTAGYTLVDTVVISTRTHKIWKSAAANNSQGLDWYLDVCSSTSGTGSLSITPMEFFDPATDLAYRVVRGGASSSVEGTYYSTHGATGYSLEHANLSLNPSVASGILIGMSTSTFGYWISVTGDRVIVMTSVAPALVTFAGLYVPSAVHVAAAGVSLYPLLVASIGGAAAASGSTASASSAGLTRIPKFVGSSFFGNNQPVLAAATAEPASTYMAANVPYIAAYSATTIDLYGYTAASQPFSGLLGSVRDMIAIPSSTIARGDTCTVGGNTYVLSSATGEYSTGFRTL